MSASESKIRIRNPDSQNPSYDCKGPSLCRADTKAGEAVNSYIPLAVTDTVSSDRAAPPDLASDVKSFQL